MDLLEEMVRLFQFGKKVDPISHKALEAVTRRQARNIDITASRLGWDALAQQARRDHDDPDTAIAKKSLIAGMIFAGGAGGGAKGATTGGVSGTSAVNTAEQIAQAGMFAPQATQTAAEQAIQQQLLAQQAAELAAKNAAIEGGGIASSGMFNQVPGVTGGSPQWQALAEQNAGFGGEGWNATAGAAKPAIADAVRNGQMGKLEGIMQSLKGDAAGMNDPSVWLDRFGKNASRLSGQAARSMASNAMSPKPQPGPAPMTPRPPQQSSMPKPQPSSADTSRAIADLQAGRITIDEFLKLMGGA